MLFLHNLAGPDINKSGPPSARQVIKTLWKCFGVAVRVTCLPYTGPLACVRMVHSIAVSVAEHGLSSMCDLVPEVLLVEGVRAALRT